MLPPKSPPNIPPPPAREICTSSGCISRRSILFGVDGNHAFACVSATETFSALSHIVPALRTFHAYEPLPEILIVSLFVIVSL